MLQMIKFLLVYAHKYAPALLATVTCCQIILCCCNSVCQYCYWSWHTVWICT